MLRKKQTKAKKKRNQNKSNNYALSALGYSAYDQPSITFIDPHRYVTLKYTELLTLSMATTVGNQQTMRLNSIFDPNSAVGGHQPYGYDQLAALYNRYRVLRTRWRITFGNQAGNYDLVVVPLNGALATSSHSKLLVKYPMHNKGYKEVADHQP
jgi:hypothetical protein